VPVKRQHQVLIVALAIVGIGALGFWWAQRRSPPPEAVAPPVAAASAPVPAVVAAASAPAILHPIEAVAAPEGPVDAAALLTDLFGRQAVAALFVLDDLPLHVAATVDNLGRPAASPRLWPVRPTPGRFSVVETKDGATVIAPDNGLRYAPLLVALESVDLPHAAQAYKRLYPQLQKEYENLGYPNGYFNDRLVEVIDSMLATPEPGGPLEVRLPNVAAASAPAHPWILYEFADPQLAALPAGQKLLLRMGPVDERRMKGRLAEFRKLIAPAPADR
jgi:hypothetical protein